MRALTVKLFRDLWHLKGPAFAIALVVAAGVAVLVGSMSALDSLELSRDAFYEEHRFADVFASARRAPASVAPRIAEIPGVTQVQARVVADVALDLEGAPEPITGRLVSIPERRAPILNDVHIREGRYIEPGRDDEVLLGEAFASARGLGPGDRIAAVIDGRRKQLTIVGVALSPEYVYQVSGGGLWPDDERFAVLWMGRDALAAALDMQGAFNDVALSLARGTSEGDVIERVDRLLAPYGGLGAYGRDRQTSDQFVSNELAQLRGVAVIIPAIFLGVAMFLLHVVVTRLVSTQRTQIATLKAFGYGNRTIALHYLQMALLLVLLGAAAGVAVGFWLGGGMTRLYANYFRFPVLTLRVTPATALSGVVVSVVAATAGVLAAVRRAAALPPAEAMRPEAPARFHRTLLERLGVHRLLSPAGRMILRSVARRPVRALLSSVGVAFAVAILVVGRFNEDAIAYLVDVSFRVVQGDDVMVLFEAPRERRALDEVERMPGVLHVEPFRAVPARIVAGHRAHRAAILGLRAGADLHRLADREARVVDVPREGLVLGLYLGRELGVRAGDVVTVELLEGHRESRRVPVALLIDDLFGASATMEIGALNRLLGEGDVVSGAYTAVDPRQAEALFAELDHTPAVAGVTSREASLRSFERTLAENLGVMRTIQMICAVIIAFAVVYNDARIALAERSRELASLRVLGFTRAEVSRILLGQLSLTTLAGIPLGLALGHGLSWLVAFGLETEMFRIPFVIERPTYVYAALVVLGAAALTALVVRRRLDRLDLVGVLKTRD